MFVPEVTCSNTEEQGASLRRKQKARPPALVAALLTIAERWQQPKCPSMDEWINKMRYIRTMEYYSTLKRKEILTHAPRWVNLDIRYAK